MTIKKKWSEWAVDMIKKTGRCPGDGPSIGSADDMMTESDFVTTVKTGGSHPYIECHHVSAMLGLSNNNTLQELDIDHDSRSIDRIRNIAGDFEEVRLSRMLATFKERLHSYVDRIHFQKDGSISVPEPLMKFEDYINKFFDQ